MLVVDRILIMLMVFAAVIGTMLASWAYSTEGRLNALERRIAEAASAEAPAE